MLHLIPAPTGAVSLEGGRLILPKTISIDHGPFERWCTAAFVSRLGGEGVEGAFLTLRRDVTLPPEGYALDIRPNGLTVSAASESGVVWALTTLYCLSTWGGIPLGVIEDAPRYPHRGLSLDCARHFFPAEEVRKIIEHLALHKINVLHWHLSDDQAWRIESRRFPRLQEVSGEYYTQAQIREIVEYARLRGVEIIPEIDLPGHTTGILAAYPEYSCTGQEVTLATKGGIYPIILCPGKEETFTFLRELLEELVPLFPGKRFHIGGDEAPKSQWKKCPCCQAHMAREGIEDPEALQGWFTRRIQTLLEGMGKTAICWNETLRGLTPENIQIQYWTRQYQGAMEAYVPTGGTWIFSEMFDLYLDYPHAMNSLKKCHQVRPFFGSVKPGREGNLLGMEACLWSEHIWENDHLERRIFPRMFALAEAAWTGPCAYGGFRSRLKGILASSLHQGLAVTAERDWDPVGSLRQQQALAYIHTMLSGTDSQGAAASMEEADGTGEAAKAFYLGFATKFLKPWDLPKALRLLKRSAKHQ